jgi:hypothetical protein
MKVMIVGGTFDRDGGKESSLMSGIYYKVLENSKVSETRLYNGGHVEKLEDYIELTVEFDIVLWFPNVPNEEEKYRNIKSFNPNCIFITSKVNNGRYSFMELVKHALDLKANLTVEFNTLEKPFQMMVFDPLANSYYSGTDVKEMAAVLIDRAVFLSGISRQGTVRGNKTIDVIDDQDFFNYVKETAEVFHDLVDPAPTTRFLGNSSFRCSKGFPSYRKDGVIFVSQRNIDKRYIGPEGFVPVEMAEDGTIMYYSDNKPSVDTPIQLRLYQALPNINYMVHAHVYVENAKFTEHNIPCGGLEEVQEILSVIGNWNTDFEVINLIGHGCIILASTVEQLKDVKFKKREVPERI